MAWRSGSATGAGSAPAKADDVVQPTRGLTQTKLFELIAIAAGKGQSRAIAQNHTVFSMEHGVQFFNLFDNVTSTEWPMAMGKERLSEFLQLVLE